MPSARVMLEAHVAAQLYESAAALRRLIVVDKLAATIRKVGTR